MCIILNACWVRRGSFHGVKAKRLTIYADERTMVSPEDFVQFEGATQLLKVRFQRAIDEGGLPIDIEPMPDSIRPSYRARQHGTATALVRQGWWKLSILPCRHGRNTSSCEANRTRAPSSPFTGRLWLYNPEVSEIAPRVPFPAPSFSPTQSRAMQSTAMGHAFRTTS